MTASRQRTILQHDNTVMSIPSQPTRRIPLVSSFRVEVGLAPFWPENRAVGTNPFAEGITMFNKSGMKGRWHCAWVGVCPLFFLTLFPLVLAFPTWDGPISGPHLCGMFDLDILRLFLPANSSLETWDRVRFGSGRSRLTYLKDGERGEKKKEGESFPFTMTKIAVHHAVQVGNKFVEIGINRQRRARR
ncbi:uncharacterized protein BO88DRAFT_96009 [Aspergillus vadensis CBS 113365]|uniref:Uncharacterized protein n=1 Tax=Aspergillus vadensis (strain CBS 113365 / IMI 142717 / IBT 24658) TaxID=1448311 RepID=A0A319BL56_ASPVC|nr:hypothetical protein BO88DRAFT_96009 [Aspergillus vadensis CBS 113365]PYH73447.1 hypothetical protein BO88DRAFT_96009 [Aspergillus vadensis CBS 113365]